MEQCAVLTLLLSIRTVLGSALASQETLQECNFSALTFVLQVVLISLVLKKADWSISLLLVYLSQTFKDEIKKEVSLFSVINGLPFEQGFKQK